MSKRQRIRNPKDNFTIMPNMYDNDDLTVYEFRLLIHYRRVGNCYESLRTTAQKCHMGKSTVERARRSLSEKGWIALSSTSKGTIAVDVIDRWTSTATYGGTNNVKNTCPTEGQVKVQRWKYSDFIREKAKGIYGLKCVFCGRQIEVLDHWISKARGGKDEDENLVASCSPCNLAKGVADGDTFVAGYLERGWIEDDRVNKNDVPQEDDTEQIVPQGSRLSHREVGCPTGSTEEVLIKKNLLRSNSNSSFSQNEWMQALIAIKQDYYRGRHTAFDQYWGGTGFAGRQDGVFKVVCQEDQQEWLEGNGKKIAENMLVGILGERVEVEFIVEE